MQQLAKPPHHPSGAETTSIPTTWPRLEKRSCNTGPAPACSGVLSNSTRDDGQHPTRDHTLTGLPHRRLRTVAGSGNRARPEGPAGGTAHASAIAYQSHRARRLLRRVQHNGVWAPQARGRNRVAGRPPQALIQELAPLHHQFVGVHLHTRWGTARKSTSKSTGTSRRRRRVQGPSPAPPFPDTCKQASAVVQEQKGGAQLLHFGVTLKSMWAGLYQKRGGGGGVWRTPPTSSQGPPMVPAEGGPKILKLESSWHRRRCSKILTVSPKHWKRRRRGGEVWRGGGLLVGFPAILIQPCMWRSPPTPPPPRCHVAEWSGLGQCRTHMTWECSQGLAPL